MKTLYQCEICNEIFPEFDKARACEKRGYTKRIANEGDIIVGYQEFGWFDGNKEWVHNWHPRYDKNFKDWVENRGMNGPIFNGAKICFNFLYKIIKINHIKHYTKYYMITGAMTGLSGYRFHTMSDQYGLISFRRSNKKLVEPKGALKEINELIKTGRL